MIILWHRVSIDEVSCNLLWISLKGSLFWIALFAFNVKMLLRVVKIPLFFVILFRFPLSYMYVFIKFLGWMWSQFSCNYCIWFFVPIVDRAMTKIWMRTFVRSLSWALSIIIFLTLSSGMSARVLLCRFCTLLSSPFLVVGVKALGC
jgi:hypothetical protein